MTDQSYSRNGERRLGLIEHLEELRGAIVKSLVCVIASSCVVYLRSGEILSVISRPIGRLVFVAPQEAFVAYTSIALCGGCIVSSPFILYQAWHFIASGLTPRERKFLIVFGPLSLALFVIGSAFGYLVITPISIRFLLGFATDTLVPMISVSRYVGFVGTMVLAFGVAFELPVGVLFLTKVGIVNPSFLASRRRHAIVIIFIVAAFLTPPDVASQILLAVPLVALFELSIALSRLVFRQRVEG